MRLFASLAILFLTAACAPMRGAPHQTALLIRNADIVSPERADIQTGMDVLIVEGRIHAIGPDLNWDGEAETLDAAGLYLTPGLIDSHVHLYHATGLKRRYSDDFAALYEAYMAQMPRSYLYYGYTSLIELNADFETNERVGAAPLAPRIHHCGQGVVLPDGFMAQEFPGGDLTAAFPHYLFDPHGGGTPPEGADPAAHTPEAVVGAIAEAGGICVKMYYEEALWHPGGPPGHALPSAEIVREMVAAAHARGFPVLLHATTPGGFEFGLETGIDIFAHGMWEWPGVAFDDPSPPARVRDVAARLAAEGALIQPTMRTVRNTASMFDPQSLDDPALRHVLPEDYLAYLRTDAQVQRDIFLEYFANAIPAGSDLADIAAMQSAFNARYERLIGAMRADGAKLLLGSDTAVGGFGWGNPPGLNGYWEMQAWARAGVPLRAIFEAATLDNARAFGLEDELGSVEIGKRADLLLLNDNPLERLSAYDAIALVIVDGQAVRRETLSAMR